jgi:hypothetical protein
VPDEAHRERWAEGKGVLPAVTPAVPRRPDNFLEFRLGRMLILLDTMAELEMSKPLHMERLGYYDFFADNPFLIFHEDDSERRRLQLAGFSRRTLSYNSAAQRFTNRRARLKHDLSLLAARSLVVISAPGRHITFSASDDGRRLASELHTFYGQAFRSSAAVVVRHLNRLSDKALTEHARGWLKAEPFLIDIYGLGEDS